MLTMVVRGVPGWLLARRGLLPANSDPGRLWPIVGQTAIDGSDRVRVLVRTDSGLRTLHMTFAEWQQCRPVDTEEADSETWGSAPTEESHGYDDYTTAP